MSIWVTSDTHYNHANIIKVDYCNRPFADVHEMEDVLVANWNARVAPADTVYHLGDFAFGNPLDVPRILSRLQGHIVLIRGNHDRPRMLRYFERVETRLDLELDGTHVRLVHAPYMHGATQGIVLCGHVHGAWVQHAPHPDVPWRNVPIYNVGVDVRGFAPVTLAEILAKPLRCS